MNVGDQLADGRRIVSMEAVDGGVLVVFERPGQDGQTQQVLSDDDIAKLPNAKQPTGL